MPVKNPRDEDEVSPPHTLGPDQHQQQQEQQHQQQQQQQGGCDLLSSTFPVGHRMASLLGERLLSGSPLSWWWRRQGAGAEVGTGGGLILKASEVVATTEKTRRTPFR